MICTIPLCWIYSDWCGVPKHAGQISDFSRKGS